MPQAVPAIIIAAGQAAVGVAALTIGIGFVAQSERFVDGPRGRELIPATTVRRDSLKLLRIIDGPLAGHRERWRRALR